MRTSARATRRDRAGEHGSPRRSPAAEVPGGDRWLAHLPGRFAWARGASAAIDATFQAARSGAVVAKRDRMHRFQVACVVWFALSSAACLEPAEPVGADDVAVADAGASVETEAAALLAPVCGGGEVTYYEWKCHWGKGWKLEEVGSQYASCGYPHWGPLDGKRTYCSASDRGVCGGGDDTGQCAWGISGSGCAQPTTPCFVWNPPFETDPPTDSTQG